MSRRNSENSLKTRIKFLFVSGKPFDLNLIFLSVMTDLDCDHFRLKAMIATKLRELLNEKFIMYNGDISPSGGKIYVIDYHEIDETGS